MAGEHPDGERFDGRHARRDRNRDAVVHAVMQYLDEGDPAPTAQMVAIRSGVSLRSVFRYFQDLDLLLLAAIEQFMETRADTVVFVQPPPGTPLAERIERYVAFRVASLPTFARAQTAAYARARTSEAIAERLEKYRRYAIRVVERLFAPELAAAAPEDRAVMLATLHSAALAEVWLNLADRHHLDDAQIAAAFRRLLCGALGVAPDA
jgi:AcrR family transcriptional regulator